MEEAQYRCITSVSFEQMGDNERWGTATKDGDAAMNDDKEAARDGEEAARDGEEDG